MSIDFLFLEHITSSQEMKVKKDRLVLIKQKGMCTTKTAINRVKIRFSEWNKDGWLQGTCLTNASYPANNNNKELAANIK